LPSFAQNGEAMSELILDGSARRIDLAPFARGDAD
jgi:hypothetical protein